MFVPETMTTSTGGLLPGPPAPQPQSSVMASSYWKGVLPPGRETPAELHEPSILSDSSITTIGHAGLQPRRRPRLSSWTRSCAMSSWLPERKMTTMPPCPHAHEQVRVP